MMQIAAFNAQGGPRAAGGTVQEPAAGASRGARPGDGEPNDQVSLSESARSVAAAYRVVDGTSWVREDVVRSVRSALASGRYAVDTRDIATRMSADLSA
jgi:flagellar biosynthesis anti-sigma factor FlgM